MEYLAIFRLDIFQCILPKFLMNPVKFYKTLLRLRVFYKRIIKNIY